MQQVYTTKTTTNFIHGIWVHYGEKINLISFVGGQSRDGKKGGHILALNSNVMAILDNHTFLVEITIL